MPTQKGDKKLQRKNKSGKFKSSKIACKVVIIFQTSFLENLLKPKTV